MITHTYFTYSSVKAKKNYSAGYILEKVTHGGAIRRYQ